MLEKLVHKQSLSQLRNCFPVVFLIIFLFPSLRAQDSTNILEINGQVVKYDSSKIEIRTFDKSALDEIRESGDFDYMEVKRVKTYSLWDRFWNWLWELYLKIFSNSTYSTAFKTVLYIICGIVIVFVALKLAGIDARNVFYGKSAKKEIKSEFLEEDIHAIDFSERIAKAVQNQEFQEAIRLHYLRNLKILSNRNLIDWKIDKTNHDYEVEIKDESVKAPFSRITYLYENICYGDFPINAESYAKFARDFEVFEQVN